MEPTVEFLIQPGGSRQVLRSKEMPARFYFAMPTLPFPKEEIKIQVNNLLLKLSTKESAGVVKIDGQLELTIRESTLESE